MHPASAEPIATIVARIFPELPPSSRDVLTVAAHDERPVAGTFLMREGRQTSHLGVIVEGRLAVRDRIGPDDVTLMTLEPGDIFGWSTVLDGISTASIVALEGARVLLFERSGLLTAIDGDPILAAGLYRRLLEAVASRLDATRLLMRDVYAGGQA
jgi:CRP-like cAMP-binding protein